MSTCFNLCNGLFGRHDLLRKVRLKDNGRCADENAWFDDWVALFMNFVEKTWGLKFGGIFTKKYILKRLASSASRRRPKVLEFTYNGV